LTTSNRDSAAKTIWGQKSVENSRREKGKKGGKKHWTTADVPLGELRQNVRRLREEQDFNLFSKSWLVKRKGGKNAGKQGR